MKQTLSGTRSPGRSSSFVLDLLRGPNLPQNEPPETRVERAHVPLPAETHGLHARKLAETHGLHAQSSFILDL